VRIDNLINNKELNSHRNPTLNLNIQQVDNTGIVFMGIPKKGSRKITVDGENFIWLIRRKATTSQASYYIDYINVAVEHVEGTGSKLVIMTDKAHPKNWGTTEVKPVVPSEVSSWINQAIKAGWEPNKSGKPFEFIVSD